MWKRKYLRIVQYSVRHRYLRKPLLNNASSERSRVGICRPDCPIQGQQPNGFQGYNFTAGIRTSNNPAGRNLPPDGYQWELPFFLSISGWRACFRRIRPSSLKIGSVAFISMARAALAKITSSCTIIFKSAGWNLSVLQSAGLSLPGLPQFPSAPVVPAHGYHCSA